MAAVLLFGVANEQRTLGLEWEVLLAAKLAGRS